MDELVSDDPSLMGNAAIKRMLQKIGKRRCYIDCVICDDLRKEVWNPMYERDRFVGWHCEDHKQEFHKIQQSGRHCCDTRTSSGDSEM